MRADCDVDRNLTSRDPLDAQTRSRIMSRVRSRDTGLELSFRRALWAAGVKGYRCNRRSVFGAPDLAWVGLRVAVFIDSAWWHGHPSRWQPGRHPARWDAKIARNRERDEQVNARLVADGWRIVRVWDFEIDRDADACVARVKEAVALARGG